MLQYVYSKYFDLNQFADAKLAGLAAVLIAFVAVSVNFNSGSLLQIASSLLSLTSLAILCTGIFPNLDPFIWSRKFDRKLDKRANILYFRDVSQCTLPDLVKQLAEYNSDNLPDEVLEDFAHQIQSYARNAYRKFSAFQLAIYPMLASLTAFSVSNFF